MLLIEEQENRIPCSFQIADTHCHLGTEDKGPSATLEQLAEAHQTLATYLPTALGKLPNEFQLFNAESVYYQPSALVQKYQLGSPTRKTGIWDPSRWLIDFATIIPLKDINRKSSDAKPEYFSTHDWIHEQIVNIPANLRYRAFARLTHANFSEIDRLPLLNFLGISLNPEMDGFLREYSNQPTKVLFVAAAKRNLPIILHIDNQDVLKTTYEILSEIHKETNYRPWLEITSDPAPWWFESQFYDLLELDGVVAELTAVSIDSILEILTTARNRFFRSHVPNTWSTKFLFGTDFPYMKPAHAAEILAFILSKQFPGDNVDRSNILWQNKINQQLSVLY